MESRRRRGLGANELSLCRNTINRPVRVDPGSRRSRTGDDTKKTAQKLQKLVKVWLACVLFGVIGGSLLTFVLTSFENDNYMGPFFLHLPNETIQTNSSNTSIAAADLLLPPTLPPPPMGNISACSCWNAKARSTCCARSIFRAHKFGTILIDSLFEPVRRSMRKHQLNLESFPKQPLANKSNTRLSPLTYRSTDYRQVAVTRNWFDAIVSGYLYHKAGFECWMNARGERKRIVRKGDWEAHLEFHATGNLSFPPRNKRSICTYLNEESEGDGLRVLMDIALSKWYKDVVPYYKFVQEQYDSASPHSLFICYEDLVDPFQQERIFRQVLNWLYPTGEAENVSIAADIQRSLAEQRQNQTIYSGGHAASRDPEIRARLRQIVERLDREVFNNTVGITNAIFGCGKQ